MSDQWLAVVGGQLARNNIEFWDGAVLSRGRREDVTRESFAASIASVCRALRQRMITLEGSETF